MLATVHSATLSGIDSVPVEVQAFFGKGLPAVDIVGLGDTAVRESRVRVKSALESSGLELPKRHVVLNLAPADKRKSGSGLDLPIALALLCAAGVTQSTQLDELLLLGELSLGGELRAVRGMLSHLSAAKERGLARAIIPAGNAHEAALVAGLDARCAVNLRDVVQALAGALELPHAHASRSLCSRAPARPSTLARTRGNSAASASERTAAQALDFSDVRGQHAAKRALEIAAAGGHNLLLLGPPGTGKTMLAQRIGSILPAPDEREALEIATIASAVGAPPPASLACVARPFRAPHHSASYAALIGGGTPIRPGEVTLAHGGVLFLDELPEFSRTALEALRPTMESGLAAVVRAHERVIWPARPLVVAAMNPCPCGHGDDPGRCVCPPERVERYRARISGPLLDRFDLHVVLKPVEARSLREGVRGEPSDVVRARVVVARARAIDREAQSSSTHESIAQASSPAALSLLDRAVDALGLSVRAYGKVLRVARTIADLDAAETVEARHLAEAIQYRVLDRRPDPASASARFESRAREC